MDPETPFRQAILEHAGNWHPHGVLSFSELLVEQAHMAASALGLPANPSHALPALRDKYVQRELLQRAGVPVPRYAGVDGLDQLRHALALVGGNAVLKPVAGVGSMATHPVSASSDLAQIWETARSEYLADPRGNGRPVFILEERLIGRPWHTDPRYGTYVSVESLVQSGEIMHLAVTDKLPLTEPFRENGGILPSSLGAADIARLHAAATDAIRAIGLTDCAVHTEFMLTADGPRVIEVNGRIGGGVTEQLFLSSGYDVVLAMAAVATGTPAPEARPARRSAAIMLPQAPGEEARLSRVPEAAEVLALPGVVSVQINYSVGQRPEWERGTAAGTLARVFAAADQPEVLLSTFDELSSSRFFSFEPVVEAEQSAPLSIR
ncbi:ATP-grasp domain-containing protein [Streptomyces sp. NPDC002076]